MHLCTHKPTYTYMHGHRYTQICPLPAVCLFLSFFFFPHSKMIPLKGWQSWAWWWSRKVFLGTKRSPRKVFFHTMMIRECFLKPVLNWANVCSPKHTLDTSTNYDLFLNWTFSLPNMVRTVQTLLHSQLACNEMQASARTCGWRAADSMIENIG